MTSDAAKPIEGRLDGVSLSPFVRKVRAVLAIKGIEYELVPVMPGLTAFVDRLSADPNLAPLIEEERSMLGGH